MSQLPLLLLLLLLRCHHSAASSLAQQYLLVFDAGSTGTRANLFHFSLDSSHSTGLRLLSLQQRKVTPGLSAYKNFPSRLRPPLRQLLQFCATSVPASFHANTTVIVRATAGLRLLAPAARRRVVAAVKEELQQSSFRVPPNAAVRVISGTEEAEFGWVAVNFLLDTFDSAGDQTVGMLDLGGGSTQITFVPAAADTADPNLVQFRTVHGKLYSLHQHSYLGLGLSAATLQMLGHSAAGETEQEYRSACLSAEFRGRFEFGAVAVNVTGDAAVSSESRAAACRLASMSTIAQHNLHSPPGVRSAKFVAVSSFYYVASTLHKAYPDWAKAVPGRLSVKYFSDAAERVCRSPPTSGLYKPYLCSSLVYIDTLLRDGYRFSPQQQLLVTNDINGRSASWPLGLAIHYLTCAGKPSSCLNPQAAADSPLTAAASAAQLLCVLIITVLL